MPVEIRQLIIKASVEETPKEKQIAAQAHDIDEIVQACVKQVIRIIEKSKER